ncbi:MAG: cytochrome c3 family protein [Candidatus Promineifilaceae bacterium]
MRKHTVTGLKLIVGLALMAALAVLVLGSKLNKKVESAPETAVLETAALESTAPEAVALHLSTSSNTPILARPASQEGETQTPADDRACRLCHSDTDAVVTFPSGETMPVQVDLDTLSGSAHGMHLDTPLACTSCHAPANYQFPHKPVEAADLEAYHLERSTTCEQCHQEPHPTNHPDSESDNPVGCVNCHGSHDIVPAAEWHTGEESAVAACVDCHTSRGVKHQEPAELTQFVENGLFAAGQENDEYCLACHSVPDQSFTFENGDEMSLTVTAAELHDSVHGADNPWQPLACNDCHEQHSFPHDPVTVESFRDYRLENYPLCSRCHEPKYESTLDDVHGQALENGNKNAAVCTDCHGSHNIPVPNEPRERISHTCQQCHSTIFDDYAQSVHGEALLEEGNPDVPTCIDCHGVHNLKDPTTAQFRVNSPKLCATCHANKELMEKYDISTQVFETYVADFHGTTVTLFEHQSPDVETNKAVCFDCHGIHDIKRPDDPHNGIKANLLETCQQCHPNATANFSDAWTSHYVPSLQHNPLVFLVNWFYRIIIPLTVGGLGFLVVTDIYRRIRKR